MNFKQKVFLFIFSLLLAPLAFAQDMAPINASSTDGVISKPLTPSEEIALYSTVKISDSKIISQEKNIFKISFSISNRLGVQPEVKYGVFLTQKDPKDKEGALRAFFVDGKVYEEVLILSEEKEIKREIIYEAPKYLSGSYQLEVGSETAGGFPLALSIVGDVTLEGANEGVEIPLKDCFLQVEGEKNSPQYNPKERIDINQGEVMVGTCKIVNHSKNSLLLVPTVKTYFQDSFGTLAPQGEYDKTSFVINPLETKTISFKLPSVTKPFSYGTTLALSDEVGNIVSNEVQFTYTVLGSGAWVKHIFLKQEQFKKGDTAEVVFSWCSPYTCQGGGFNQGARNKAELAGEKASFVTLSMTILDGNRKQCSAPSEKVLLEKDWFTLASINIPIEKDCPNPIVDATLKNKNGDVLFQKSFDMGEKSNSYQVLSISIVFLLLVFFVTKILMVFKRKNNLETVLKSFLFVFLLSAFFLGDSATTDAWFSRGCPLVCRSGGGDEVTVYYPPSGVGIWTYGGTPTTNVNVGFAMSGMMGGNGADKMKFGIDWDDSDGLNIVDEWTSFIGPAYTNPADGYSRYETSASHLWSSSGIKKIGIIAQNQGGLTSGWRTTTITVNQKVIATPTIDGPFSVNIGSNPIYKLSVPGSSETFHYTIVCGTSGPGSGYTFEYPSDSRIWWGGVTDYPLDSRCSSGGASFYFQVKACNRYGECSLPTYKLIGINCSSYSDWGVCTNSRGSYVQTRTGIPAGCTAGEDLVRSCRPPCTSYSEWGTCFYYPAEILRSMGMSYVPPGSYRFRTASPTGCDGSTMEICTAEVDSGIRINQGGGNIVKIAADPTLNASSPLRIMTKSGVKSIPVTSNFSDPRATKIRIMTKNGVRALLKY